MSEVLLVRNGKRLTQAQIDGMMPALFGIVDGLSQTDKASWRRFWGRVTRLEEGEVFSVDTWAPRVGGYHRRHMVFETTLFRSQERVASFQAFRDWLKIAVGFCEWYPGVKGGVVPVPKSISYKKCDEDTMRAFHGDIVAFCRTPHAQHFLWPHLTPEKAEEMMEVILQGFEE